ncbi:MAG TPA: DUF1349 domain-containing protein [Candidatus Angelobacter sp.]
MTRSVASRSCFLIAVAAFLFVSLAHAQSTPELTGIPGTLDWHNTPTAWHITGNTVLNVSSGAKTDWFVDPFDGTVANSAPILWFVPADTYVFSARVKVRFSSKWDAGALMLWADDHNWAKLSFELSPDKKPTLVTVVTRGVSDDCNSESITGDTVFLQIARTGQTYVFYYSTDGSVWHILRTFNLATTNKVFLGFESQSPDGAGSSAVFSRIQYAQRKIANIYTGK